MSICLLGFLCFHLKPKVTFVLVLFILRGLFDLGLNLWIFLLTEQVLFTLKRSLSLLHRYIGSDNRSIVIEIEVGLGQDQGLPAVHFNKLELIEFGIACCDFIAFLVCLLLLIWLFIDIDCWDAGNCWCDLCCSLVVSFSKDVGLLYSFCETAQKSNLKSRLEFQLNFELQRQQGRGLLGTFPFFQNLDRSLCLCGSFRDLKSWRSSSCWVFLIQVDTVVNLHIKWSSLAAAHSIVGCYVRAIPCKWCC